MKDKISAFKEISADISVVKYLISSEGNPENDEAMYNIASYHSQQAVEKALKFYLRDILGENEEDRRFKTHDIAELSAWLMLEYDVTLPSELIEKAELITSWESNSRYGHSLVESRENILAIIPLLEKLRDNVREFEDKISNGIKVSIDDIYSGCDNEDMKDVEKIENIPE